MKTVKMVFAFVVAVLLLGGCVGVNSLGVLDESVPEAQRCPLEVRNSLSVIIYDDQPVNWSSGFTKDKIRIELPPGNHTFMLKYYITRSIGPNISEAVPKTASVSMEFIPGHSYRIYKQNIWLVFLTITNVKIKDVTPKGQA